jgi:phosphotransferase system HPr-like phosphotransfer protein
MATYEEMLRLEAETKEAERQALRDLAAHLREAIIGLPVHSRVAMTFVEYSQRFDLWATGGNSAVAADSSLGLMLNDLARGLDLEPEEDES